MKYAVIYVKSEWAGKGVAPPPRHSTLAELETMPPYGATIAGNVLRNLRGDDFIGVLDEYTTGTPIEDAIDCLKSANRWLSRK